MNLEIFEKFSSVIDRMSDQDLATPELSERLLMHQELVRGRDLRMVYAPFDFVNERARIVIVGMTPGRYQASGALKASRDALRYGKSAIDAAEAAKVHASFSGEPMRSNLIAMLDEIGVDDWLGVNSTAALWSGSSHLVHFTSALRYPVFVDGQNWSGTPDMIRTRTLCSALEDYTGQELMKLSGALIVPLGPKVATAMLHLAKLRRIEEKRILIGLPHPSGANAERIAYFLGRKTAAACSAKTNPVSLDAAKNSLIERVLNLPN